MLVMAICMFCIEGLITGFLMVQLVGWICTNVPSMKLKVATLKFFNSAPVSFLINLGISTMLTWFTNVGLIAGFANLGSSIAVAIIVPWIIERKYPLDQMIERAEYEKTARKVWKEERKRLRRLHKEAV